MKLNSIKPSTIKEMVERIDANEILLPSMQRKAIWNEKQIVLFFDSIMKGYPFGTLIFWNILNKEESNRYLFYHFIKDYSLRDESFSLNKKAGKIIKDIDVVMDGQQRLTALYVGIKGNLEKLVRPGARKTKSENWKITHLYFKPFVAPDERDEDDSQFSFEFLEDSVVEQFNKGKNKNEKYYLVSDLYGMQNAKELKEYLNEKSIPRDKTNWKYQLNLLRENLNDNKLLYYHEISNANITDVLEVFKRINNGGTALSPTNLMFSTIITSWEEGREKIENLVRNIKNKGIINLSEKLVIRICLYVMNQPTSAKIESITSKVIDKIKNNWERIEGAIYNTQQFLENNGISSDLILSNNALLPIIYYYYYSEKMSKEVEEEFIKFFVISQVFGLFGGSSQNTLQIVREKLCKDGQLGKINKKFNLANLKNVDLSAGRYDAFTIKEDQIKNIVDNTFYHDKKAFLMQRLLYPKAKVGDYDLDHVCSKDETKKFVNYKKYDEKRKEIENMRNGFANLQILDASVNRGDKSKDTLYTWVVEKHNIVEYDPFRYDSIDKEKYKIKDLETFKEFYDGRRKIIIEKLVDILK